MMKGGKEMMGEEMPDHEDMSDDAGAPEGVTEDYLKSVHKGTMDLIPEDFKSADVSLSTDADDGEQVAFLVTGTAQGGKIADVYAAPIDLQNEPMKESRLKKAFQEEED